MNLTPIFFTFSSYLTLAASHHTIDIKIMGCVIFGYDFALCRSTNSMDGSRTIRDYFVMFGMITLIITVIASTAYGINHSLHIVGSKTDTSSAKSVTDANGLQSPTISPTGLSLEPSRLNQSNMSMKYTRL